MVAGGDAIERTESWTGRTFWVNNDAFSGLASGRPVRCGGARTRNEGKSIMSASQQVRESVSKAYAKAVSTEPGGNCCCAPVQKSTVAKLAGYTSDELASLPAEAVVNSFGCGNPLAFSEIKEGEVVLDLGSGAGIDLLLAAKKVGPSGKAIGVDMTDEMIAKGRENVAASGLDNVDVRKGLIEDLPVESGSLDWVISNCVINLSPEKPKVFAEIARVLKPGGRMLVSDIVAEDLPDWVHRNEALHNSCIAGAISEEKYLDGLRQAGLVDVEVRDRIVYDASQLEAFATTELPDNEELLSCCGGPAGADSIGDLAEKMVGKIWSAKIYAKKPASQTCC